LFSNSPRLLAGGGRFIAADCTAAVAADWTAAAAATALSEVVEVTAACDATQAGVDVVELPKEGALDAAAVPVDDDAAADAAIAA